MENKKKKIPEAIFYTGLTIELLILVIDKSAFHNPIEGRLFQITFLLFLVKLMMTKYSLKEWLCIIGFGTVGLISYQASGRNEILRFVVFIACMRDIDLGRCLKYVFSVTLAGCLLIVGLSMAGIYGDVSLYQEYRKGSTENRYTFGMGHPNALHCMYFMVVLLFMYLWAGRLKVWMFFGLFAVNLLLYYFTDSRTGMLITTFGIMAGCITEKIRAVRNSKWLYIAGILTLILCVGISVWVAVYSEMVWYWPWFKKIDAALSGRFQELFYGSLNHEGTIGTWKLFSSPGNTYMFDMGWVRLFYWYGIIPGIIGAALTVLLFLDCGKKRNYMGAVMLLSLTLYTVIEAHIVSVYLARNYLLFLMAGTFSTLWEPGQRGREYWFKAYRLLPGIGR